MIAASIPIIVPVFRWVGEKMTGCRDVVVSVVSAVSCTAVNEKTIPEAEIVSMNEMARHHHDDPGQFYHAR